MKKTKQDPNEIAMRDEYDFSKGIRGKHYKAYREGHTVIVKKEDGAIMLDADIEVHFPNSESVNKALRSLIPTALN